MTMTFSKELSTWNQERVAIQRNVLLRNDPRLLMIFAKKMDLKHWHDKTGIVYGTYDEGCGLCKNGGKP